MLGLDLRRARAAVAARRRRLFLRRKRPQPQKISELLRQLPCYGDEPRISFRAIIECLGPRAHGLSVVFFALPSCLPMPPGVPMLSGAVLVVIAVQLVLGVRLLWLPRVLGRRTIDRADLARLVERIDPKIERVERVSRPRLSVLTERPGQVAVGVMVLVLGLLLFLPIPFLGNIPPAVAAVILGIGLAERDGVLVLIGFGAGILATIVASSAAWAAMLGLAYLAGAVEAVPPSP